MNIHFYDKPIPVIVELFTGQIIHSKAIACKESDSWLNKNKQKRTRISFLIHDDFQNGEEPVWVNQDQIRTKDWENGYSNI